MPTIPTINIENPLPPDRTVESVRVAENNEGQIRTFKISRIYRAFAASTDSIEWVKIRTIVTEIPVPLERIKALISNKV